MEGTNALNSKLAFLQTAIHKIAVESPTVAATLGAERDLLLQSLDADLNMSAKELRQLRQETCGACAYEGQDKKKKVAGKEIKREGNGSLLPPMQSQDNTAPGLQTAEAYEEASTSRTGSVPSTIGVVVPVMETPEIKNSAPKTASTSSKQRAKARKVGYKQCSHKAKYKLRQNRVLGWT